MAVRDLTLLGAKTYRGIAYVLCADEAGARYAICTEQPRFCFCRPNEDGRRAAEQAIDFWLSVPNQSEER